MNDAIFSSERQSERTKLGLASVAERGGWGGGIRPFGYSLEPQPAGRLIKYRLEPNPAEAELLREAVSRILLGGSLTAVVKDWAHRKPPVRGSKGGRLNTQRLRQILTGPAIAGLRVNGVDKGGNEIFVAAEWEPIIPRPEWERLRLILADPPRQRGPKGPRLYLLGVDLLECACTGRMAPHPRPGGRRGYQCDAQKGGCGKLRRTAIPLEDHVRDMALKALSSEETRAELVAQLPDVDATARAQQLIADREAQRARLVKLRDKLADDAIDDDDFAHAKARITARIDEIEAQLARTADTSSALIATLPSTFEALRAAWETWPLDQRRAVVKLVIRKVRITGRLTPGTRFADDQVEIDWRV